MNKIQNKNVWFIVDHPNQLAIILPILEYWKDEGLNFNLIISHHPYWNKIDLNPYKNRFNKIIILPRPDYTKTPLGFIHTIWKIIQVKKEIKKLNIEENDTIIGLSILHYVENIILSIHKKNTKIAILSLVVYRECIRDIDNIKYKKTIEGLIFNIFIEPLFKLYPTYYLEKRDFEWCKIIGYKNPLLSRYDRIIILNNLSLADNIKSKNTLLMPYPYCLQLTKFMNHNQNTKKIIFFGDSFVSGRSTLSLSEYIIYLDQCLEFLRHNYKNKYQLVFRPHPKDQNGYLDLNLKDFIIENDGKNAELYFFENKDIIHSVYSVNSTACQSAFYFFIEAYFFIDFFPFPEEIKSYWKLEMGNIKGSSIPEPAFIKELSRMPQPYINKNLIREYQATCQEVLNRLIKWINP
jgi:hypothetical protein